MREAVILSTARTPIGKAYRGALNATQAQALGGHAIAEAVRRSGVAPDEVRDVIMGAALQQGSAGSNVARQAALRAGLPTSVAAMSVDRQCASGLMGIALATQEIIIDGIDIAVGGGLEFVSLVQNEHANSFRCMDPALMRSMPALYMSMLETAEIVAERYQVSREAQDVYALQSQQRTAQAQVEGRFAAEIVPVATTMTFVDKHTGAEFRTRRHAVRGRVQSPPDIAGGSSAAEACLQGRAAGSRGPFHYRRQRVATVRWRLRLRAHGS